VTLTDFFAPMRSSPGWDSDICDTDFDLEADAPPYIQLENGVMDDPTIKWSRVGIFDSCRGSLGVISTIFKRRGTPTEDVWPVSLSRPPFKMQQPKLQNSGFP
jgi:hypothetical protein